MFQHVRPRTIVSGSGWTKINILCVFFGVVDSKWCLFHVEFCGEHFGGSREKVGFLFMFLQENVYTNIIEFSIINGLCLILRLLLIVTRLYTKYLTRICDGSCSIWKKLKKISKRICYCLKKFRDDSLLLLKPKTVFENDFVITF